MKVRAEPDGELMLASDVELTDAELGALEAWARKEMPTEAAAVRHHLATCFDHFSSQARPELRTRKGWISTVRNWVRRAPEFRRKDAPTPVDRSGRTASRAEQERAARELSDLEQEQSL